PKIGYIDDIIQKNVKKKLEKLIINNQIPPKNIYKLAKNNYNLFNSSEILRKYIVDKDQQDSDIQVTEVNKEYTNIINHNLSTLKNNEYVIFKIPEEPKEHKSIIGKAIVYNKNNIYHYNFIEIDYSLIKLYFRYAHFYMTILNEAMYAAVYMYKPNPDIQKAKEYAISSYNSIVNNYYSPDIQLIQASSSSSSSSISGTNVSWTLVGVSAKFSHTLNLTKDIKGINKKYINERKIVYWYSGCKSILLCVITGRTYRYDISDVESELNHIDNPEKVFLEKTIKYWLKQYEPGFDYEYDIEKEELGHIIAFSQHNIFFCTLKIIFYRHQSTSFVTTKKLQTKVLNSSEGIGYNFTKYEKHEKKKYNMFFKYSLNFINNKKKIKIKENENEKAFPPYGLYEGKYLECI
ncbi:hypothetical protein PIROE2DRAFT_8931, partial [Piromyces sp. E2]